MAYHQDIEYSGPLFKFHKIKRNKVVLTFSRTGRKLIVKGKTLKGFSTAGADKFFVPGTATIKGKKVIVSADLAGKPAAVRYGFENVPDVNLYNTSCRHLLSVQTLNNRVFVGFEYDISV